MATKDPVRLRPRSPDEIKKILQQHKPEHSELWKVKSLGIFGSYIRGEATESSDLNLLVDIDDPKNGLAKIHSQENHLSDLPGVKVDLAEKQTLKPAVGRPCAGRG